MPELKVFCDRVATLLPAPVCIAFMHFSWRVNYTSASVACSARSACRRLRRSRELRFSVRISQARDALAFAWRSLFVHLKRSSRLEVSNPARAATSLPVTAQPGVVVVVPAHNEFGALWRCLGAVRTAAVAVAIPTWVVVVLDACDDESSTLAGQFGPDVHFVAINERNVGAARSAGFRYARTELDAVGERVWYATTDADTEVGADWLVRQLGWGADMVLGQVRVTEWRHHSEAVAAAYEARYRAEMSWHHHIHGANMGFRSDAYWRVGGFEALASGEDVDLVERFRAAGMRVCSDDQLWVTTSDRGEGRAPGGFADHLADVTQEVADTQARVDEVS